MKGVLLTFLVFSLFSCTKQRLEKFNNRIVGSWNLVEVNTFGLGSSNIVFDGGYFSFDSDNSAAYTDRAGIIYYGKWHIDTYTYTDDDGNTETDFILTIDVGNGQQQKFDQLEIPNFGNANRFKAKVYNTLNAVTYVFERK